MKKVINKILKAISSAIFVVLIIIIAIILLYVIYVQVLTSKGKTSDIKVNFYTILTQSMYPTISAGDIVVSYKNDDDIYKVGDIITFVSTGSATKGITITHRVIEVLELNGTYSYRTQGDNNNVSDSSSVPSKNVIGKVVFKVPKAGYIQQFLVTKTGWIIAIVIPCLGIIVYDILKMLKSIKKGSKNNKKLVVDDSVVEKKEKLYDIINNDDQNDLNDDNASSFDEISKNKNIIYENSFDDEVINNAETITNLSYEKELDKVNNDEMNSDKDNNQQSSINSDEKIISKNSIDDKTNISSNVELLDSDDENIKTDISIDDIETLNEDDNGDDNIEIL